MNKYYKSGYNNSTDSNSKIKEFLGYVQPIGLVVSPSALSECQAYIDDNIKDLHTAFLNTLTTTEDNKPRLSSLKDFLINIMEWLETDIIAITEDSPLKIIRPETWLISCIS